jgi:hypothetical protein
MTTNLVVIQRYAESTDALHDKDYLYAAGIHAEIVEVPDEDSETGTVRELRVDKQNAREAYRALRDYYESEKDEKFELMGDWGD